MMPINEMRRLFEQVGKQPLKVNHMMCGKCFKDMGTNVDCPICRDIIDWAKEQDANTKP